MLRQFVRRSDWSLPGFVLQASRRYCFCIICKEDKQSYTQLQKDFWWYSNKSFRRIDHRVSVKNDYRGKGITRCAKASDKQSLIVVDVRMAKFIDFGAGSPLRF